MDTETPRLGPRHSLAKQMDLSILWLDRTAGLRQPVNFSPSHLPGAQPHLEELLPTCDRGVSMSYCLFGYFWWEVPSLFVETFPPWGLTYRGRLSYSRFERYDSCVCALLERVPSDNP